MHFTGGLPETACGLGSTLAVTENLRAKLPTLLGRLGVRFLLDAPCGDCNWISKVEFGQVQYIGVDYDEGHVSRAAANFPKGIIGRLDILAASALPSAGAVLCRDFLQHLPTEVALSVLKKLLTTGAEWFLLTSHKAEKNEDTTLGGFRPLDLMRPPVSLPLPTMLIADPPGSGRIIGVWPRAALEAI